MRVGITKRMELRLGGEGYGVNRFAAGGSSRGHTDGEIGLKYKILDETGKRPAFSVLPILSLPVGRSEFSSGGYDPSVKLLWAKDLTAGFTLAGNVNFGSYKDGEQRLFQSVSTWSVGRGLVGNLSAHWEVFVLAPYELDSGNAWIFNGGITHPWGKHAQLDLRIGKRMTAVGPNWFVGAGVALRQPTKLFLR
jgi:hypothetical protein